MKTNNHPENAQDIEIIKAVAQAWHGHFTNSKTTTTINEFDAPKRNFKSNPSRFKLEAMKMASRMNDCNTTNWNFGQSLWDSYEIVTLSKKLENGGFLQDHHPLYAAAAAAALDMPGKSGKKSRESKNSLRNLFTMSSRRFNEDDLL